MWGHTLGSVSDRCDSYSKHQGHPVSFCSSLPPSLLSSLPSSTAWWVLISARSSAWCWDSMKTDEIIPGGARPAGAEAPWGRVWAPQAGSSSRGPAAMPYLVWDVGRGNKITHEDKAESPVPGRRGKSCRKVTHHNQKEESVLWPATCGVQRQKRSHRLTAVSPHSYPTKRALLLREPKKALWGWLSTVLEGSQALRSQDL